ncbi:MAG: flagellar capping protein, partial [Pseudobutyrivibrio sp.]|nr:flagellar capping protein [Pseudobutyrivibrio sp.]
MARIDTAYNYFMTTYGDNIGNRYESHKKSELRDTYNRIVKANKDSPLYKIKDTEDMGQFAIDIKEHANSMALSVSNLSSAGEDISSIMDKRIASSSQQDSVDAIYVGDADSDAEPFTIEVNALATPQVNTGNFLQSDGHDFAEGQYSFDLDIKNHSYEFQFNVNKGETNLNVQTKIVRLLNTSDVGLSASLISDDKTGSKAIQVVSKATGHDSDEDLLFGISSTISWRELNTLGINRVTQQPANSSFKLNGTEHQSLSNTFTVNKTFELVLKAASNGEVNIGLMNDTEALSNGINQLLDSYNGMIDIGLKYNGAHQNRTLFNEISSIARNQAEVLESVGITADSLGHLSLDKESLAETINNGDSRSAFDTLNELKSSIGKAASKASINPMAYVDKAIVEYKNPGKSLAAPYAASAYSGMMMNYG